MGTLLLQGMFRSPKLLACAKGQRCQNCGAQDGTVVSAHSNEQAHGRGSHFQAHDCYIAWLCVRCHHWYDHGCEGRDPTDLYNCTREDKRAMFFRAMHRTWLEWFRHKLLMVA